MATGVGWSVIVDGTLAMMPGFFEMCGAQMPARYDSADCSSAAWADQELIHSWTFLVKPGL